MALTNEQLDALKAVKGKNNPALWDHRCQQYLDNKAKTVGQKPVKTSSTS
tara:strand:+ start:2273 stop:2422 length:150 start_codon:yes stop_codon:yes gene_type:complete